MTAESDNGTLLAEFELASRPGNEREAIARVAGAVAGLGLAAARLERLKTAVAEATMNAMEHGSEYRAERPVRIRVLRSAGRLRVQVSDAGSGPGPVALDAPDLEAKLAGEDPPRGWGLFLIEKMVDEATVTDAGGRRTLELVMRLQGEVTMAVRELEASVRERDGVAVLDLVGDIDSAAEPALQRAFDEVSRSARAVVLNFSGIAYINSTGIALIVGLLAQARTQGVEMAACGLSDHYREIFEITRLADFMRIAGDEHEAVAGYR